jgi:hypothetical protein
MDTKLKTRKLWNNDELKLLTKYANDGLTTSKISELLGRQKPSIVTKLKSLSLNINYSDRGISKDNLNQLIADYKLYVPYEILCKKYNLSEVWIRMILKTNNIIRKPKFDKNLLNKKIGMLKVIQIVEQNNSRRKGKWLCKCDCGNQIIVTDRWLRECKNNISCGCHHKKIKSELYFKGYKDISKTFFSAIKRNAYRRQLDFNVTIKQLWKLYLKQNKKCSISGLDIKIAQYGSDKNTASLDRIDSNKGYVKGNIQWVHKDINLMKGSFIDKYYIDMCKIVYENNFKSF